MRNIFFRSILYVFVFFCCPRASDNGYEYSSIVSVPDLSFFNHVYTGLDILEQMDFDLLQDKNIGIFCNHTAVTRNNKHLLDMLSNVDNIKCIIKFTTFRFGEKRGTPILIYFFGKIL